MLPHVPLITLSDVGQGAGDPQARDARQAVDHGSAMLYYAVLNFQLRWGRWSSVLERTGRRAYQQVPTGPFVRCAALSAWNCRPPVSFCTVWFVRTITGPQWKDAWHARLRKWSSSARQLVLKRSRCSPAGAHALTGGADIDMERMCGGLVTAGDLPLP